LPLLGIFYGNPPSNPNVPTPFSHPKKMFIIDDDLNYLQLKIDLFKEFDTMCYSSNFPVAKFIVHDWGDKIDSGTHCPKTLETKIMLLELMLYRMYACVLLDIKNLYSLYKNFLCCI
jgi:hypothetical protein